MVYFPLEDMLPKAEGNSYKLISLAAKRALELSNGAAKLVAAPAIEKLTTTAMREILEGKVVLKSVSDKFIPTNT